MSKIKIRIKNNRDALQFDKRIAMLSGKARAKVTSRAEVALVKTNL